jgi:hypothetical protein
MYHEWRDNASTYRAGPSLRVLGRWFHLCSRVNTLTKLPHSQWVHFEIEYELSGAADLQLASTRARATRATIQQFNGGFLSSITQLVRASFLMPTKRLFSTWTMCR